MLGSPEQVKAALEANPALRMELVNDLTTLADVLGVRDELARRLGGGIDPEAVARIAGELRELALNG
jgi:enoyl-CoA hydratase/carnithine racemase